MAIDFSKYRKNKDEEESPSGKIDFTKYKKTSPSESPTKIDFSKYKKTEPIEIEKPKKKKGVLDKTMGVLKSIDRNVHGAVDAFGNALTLGLANKLNDKIGISNEAQDSIGGTIGKIGGEIAGVSKAYKLTKPLTNKLTKNIVNKYGKSAIDGIVAGALFGGAKEIADATMDTRNNGNDSLLKRAGNVGTEAALFGAGDVALTGLVKGVKTISDKTGLTAKLKSKLTSSIDEVASTTPTGKTVDSLSDAVGLKSRITETQKALQKTEKAITSVNKSIQKNGLTEPLKTRLKDLSKESAGFNAILKNSNAKLNRSPVDNMKVDKVELTPDNVKSLVSVATKDIDYTKLKDFSGFKFNTTDIYRNFRDVFKGNYDQVKKTILDPFDASKKDYASMQETLTQSLKTNVVDKLGIQKGSKLSALVQDFGEKKLTLEQLKELRPKDWEKVVEADGFFRKTYDELLDQINATRARIYPRNPEKQIPKRDDYYRHFKEFNSLVGLKNIFDTPAAISPSLEGISEFTKPSSKYQGFMQKRGLGEYKKDAIGGFLEYIPGASYATHIDPHINVFKKLGDDIATKTEESKNLNSFINYLGKYSQDLAGKTNAADRWLQENIPGGRMTMGALNWINNRVKTNVILGNVASSLAQTANIPNGIAFAKQHAIKGAGNTLASIFNRNVTPIKESGFIKERFIDGEYRQFDKSLIDQPKKLASWLIETADRIGTEFIWNSAHAKGLAERVADPIKYADDATRSLIAGRGIGEVPLLQKAKVFQLVAPFQLEVANLWRVQGDMVKAKDFTGIATLFVGSYLFNKAMEEIRGSGVVFDPIQATVDALQPHLSVLERVGRLGGEVLSNVPLGQTVASVYPEYGGNFLGVEKILGDLPTREKLFGDKDPTRFGTGIPVVRGLQDPLYMLGPSFGGNQVKKTIEGTKSLIRGGYEKDEKLRFPVENTPANMLRGVLFGPSATSEGKEYYDNDRRPLSEQQTKGMKSSETPQEFYTNILRKREFDKINRKMDEVSADKKLTSEERKKTLDKLRKEFADLRAKYDQ